MDKAFGQVSQPQFTMLNKMIGRAFASVVLPVALTMGMPSLASAEPGQQFADPQLRQAPIT